MVTRREKVILDIESNLAPVMVRDAAAAKLLSNSLDGISGHAVTSARDSERLKTSLKGVGDEVERTSTSMRDGTKDIDRYSGRLRLITEAAVTLGPALIPIGAAGIPAVMGLAAGLGAAAGALGVTLLAVHGLGDGLKALNAYQIEPTTANLEKMRAAMDKLGPSGAEFVRFLDSLEPELRGLQEVARAGFFPGVEDGINSLLSLMPQVRVIVFNLTTEMGRLASEAGDALSGERWRPFFDYLESDAGPLLSAFSHSLGNVAEGLANLFVAFGPLSLDFANGLERMTQSFADWSAGLSGSQGFQDFVSYLRQTGPQVLDLIGSLASALAGIVTAAAPVGSAVLPVLTALADILGTIADSPIGPPLYTGVAALFALNRAAIVANTSMAALGITTGTTAAKLSALGAAGAALAIGLGTFSDNQSMLDSLHRSGDAADTTATSFEELAAALQSSNVGKYASDLGINVQQLAEDLVRNGESGEYASQVMDQLAGSSHGFGAMLDSIAGGALPFYTAGADKAYDANKDLKAIIEGTNGVLGSGIVTAEDAAAAQRRYAQANNLSARIARQTRTEINGLVAAMEEQTSAALGAFDAVTQYGQALDAARAAAKKGKRGIDETTEAGRENRQALSQLAGAWNNQSDAVRNNVDKWHEARKAFIDTATAMGVPEKRAKALADRLMEIPRSVVIKMDAKADPALQAIARIKRELASVPRSIRTDYYVNQVNAISRPRGPVPQAGGGTVPKTGLPYADRHLYLLADGEEIISNRRGQADRFRPLLKAINNAADGATVGHARVGAGGTPDFGLVGPVGAVRDMLTGLGRLGEKELKHREKLLDRQQTLAEKELAAAKERLDEERAALKDLRQARKDFMQQVASNFRSDIFGGTDLEAAARQGLLGGDFMQSLLTWLRDNNVDLQAGTNVSDYAGQYLATLTPAQIAALQAQASLGTLQQNSQDANAFAQVLQQLQDMGLTGGAFNELAASGNLSQAQAYLAMGPDFLKSLMQEFRGRNQDLKNLGQYVGNVRFGADIREQLQETRKALRVAEEQRDELRAIKHAQRDVANRLDRIEKNSPKKTGEAVAGALDKGAAASQRRH